MVHHFDEKYPHLGGAGPDMKLKAGDLYHPAANLMPMMGKEDVERLATSIAQNGLREPIVTVKGAILDGRNRFKYYLGRANIRVKGGSRGTLDYLRDNVKTVDGRPAVIELDMNMAQAVRYVLDKNLTRRHLSTAQKKDVLFNIRQLFGSNAPGGNNNPEGAGGKSGKIVKAPNDAFTKDAPTQEELAADLGLSRRTVQRADKADKEEREQAEAEGRDPLPPSQRPKPVIKPDPEPDPPSIAALADHILEAVDAGDEYFWQDLKAALIKRRPVLKTVFR